MKPGSAQFLASHWIPAASFFEKRAFQRSVEPWMISSATCWAYLAHPHVAETHYAQGKVLKTGVNTSARLPLASWRKVMPVSRLIIRLLLQTRKVKNACTR